MSRLVIFFSIVITLGLAILLSWLGWSTIPTNVPGWFLLITGLTYFVGVIVLKMGRWLCDDALREHCRCL